MLLRFHVGAQTGRSQTWRRKRKSLGLCENKPAQLAQMSWARVLYEQMVEGNTARDRSWKGLQELMSACTLQKGLQELMSTCTLQKLWRSVGRHAHNGCILKVSFRTLWQFKTSDKAKGIHYQCRRTDMVSDLPPCPQVVGLWQLNLISD